MGPAAILGAGLAGTLRLCGGYGPDEPVRAGRIDHEARGQRTSAQRVWSDSLTPRTPAAETTCGSGSRCQPFPAVA